MHPPVERLVLIPRFSAMVGDAVQYLAPVDIRRFQAALLACWESEGVGATPSQATFQVQESADLENWHDIGDPFPGTGWTPGSEWVERVEFDLPWIRMKVTLSEDNRGVSVWLAGEFIPRETAGE